MRPNQYIKARNSRELSHCVIGTTCKTPSFQRWWGARLGNGRDVYKGVPILYVWRQRIHQSSDREPQHLWFGSRDWAPTVHPAGKERQLLSLRLLETLANSTVTYTIKQAPRTNIVHILGVNIKSKFSLYSQLQVSNIMLKFTYMWMCVTIISLIVSNTPNTEESLNFVGAN